MTPCEPRLQTPSSKHPKPSSHGPDQCKCRRSSRHGNACLKSTSLEHRLMGCMWDCLGSPSIEPTSSSMLGVFQTLSCGPKPNRDLHCGEISLLQLAFSTFRLQVAEIRSQGAALFQFVLNPMKELHVEMRCRSPASLFLLKLKN